jgi:hypothetical protein
VGADLGEGHHAIYRPLRRPGRRDTPGQTDQQRLRVGGVLAPLGEHGHNAVDVEFVDAHALACLGDGVPPSAPRCVVELASRPGAEGPDREESGGAEQGHRSREGGGDEPAALDGLGTGLERRRHPGPLGGGSGHHLARFHEVVARQHAVPEQHQPDGDATQREAEQGALDLRLPAQRIEDGEADRGRHAHAERGEDGGAASVHRCPLMAAPFRPAHLAWCRST